ncbi:MAG: neutral/alkaline non-lysosomal ceramidase N-terminal domain-containing protein [Deltaproteobacteria bacterium]|nr:neutral/alkaline non-lysosomal ceramidase N-terminal domain-containing protein [Deltaproteobacteria bacterium]
MNMLRIWKIFFLAVAFLFILTGCAFFNDNVKIEISRQTPQQEIANTTLMAGAAKADITPPPGMPMGGYSIWANYGKGFRTRLYTRVLYLKPASGRAVALVQCDLLTGSLLLNHRVAELIAGETDIGIDGLLIAGTHTHSAPGNYFENNFYNDNASNAAGFDPEYFNYLSRQIANAVVRAFKEKRSAKIATGKTQIWEMTRNRSIESYYANKNVSAKTPPDIYNSINPDMYMIRVDSLDNDGQYHPLAAISSFSIHGTAVPAKNNFYNGDVFAYIEREVEYDIKNGYKTSWEPIHAAFNGTHADSSPNYRKDMQGFIEARRIGTSIGQKAFELFRSLDGKLKNDATIRFLARETDVFSEPCVDETCLCDRPVVGCALAAGADDGPSPVISKLPWLRQGSPRWFFTNSCQGHKRNLAGPLQNIFLPKNDFPHQLLLQMIQINDVLLLPLPFETTKEAGVRIAEQCRDKLLSEKLQSFVVISCANGYYGYVTTPEEYSIQRYEGGHTLYGPQTQPFLAKQLSKMALEMGQGKSENNFPEKWSYNLRAKRFFASEVTGRTERKTNTHPVFIAAKINDEPYWSFVWEDLPPHLLSWEKTLVRIEKSDDGVKWEQLRLNRQPLDDSGYDIAILCNDVINQGKTGIYETRWYNPPVGEKKDSYRFVILPQAGQDLLYSASFHQEDAMKQEKNYE